MDTPTEAPTTPVTAIGPPKSLQNQATNFIATFPWWVLAILLAGLFLAWNIFSDETYSEIIANLSNGLITTVRITISAYIFAITIGLFTALGQLSHNVVVRNLTTLYVQIIRGVPIIVQIFYIAFVLVPLAIEGANGIGASLADRGILSEENFLVALHIRNFNFEIRGIIALAISYGAFSSEIFRAGIQSIEIGQVEAAKALGFTRAQSLRLIILPQAIRRVLPPMGNDFIAMLKESSLISVLGVGEITFLSKKYAAASFRYPETYNTLAFLYLSMTLVLSMGVKIMERRLKTRQN